MMDRIPPGWLVCASCLALVMTAGAGAVRSQGTEKSLFVSVLDASGAPVTDLAGADFALREDGVDIEVLSATLATDPLRVALLADTSKAADTYITDIRAGLRVFVHDVLSRSRGAQVSLWEFGQASTRTVDFSSDEPLLQDAVAHLFPKPQAPSVLLEALYDTSEALGKRPSPRRAIVLLNLEPSDEQSREEPKKIAASLARSRAQVWAVSVQKGSLKGPARDVVLNTIVRNAGGLREFIVAESAVERYMRQYAAALAAQYELRYRRPRGTAKIVQTGVRREGVKVIAGITAPQ